MKRHSDGDSPDDSSRLEVRPWPEVGSHISVLASTLDSLLATIQHRFERNNRNLALFSLGYKALQEVRRVVTHLEDEIEQLAWSVRNLHEIDLILRYVLQSEANLKHWVGQMLADEKEIVEGFLVLEDVISSEQSIQFKERLKRLEEVCARLGLTMQRPWRIDQLAKATNRQKEYRNLYKFYSKFVHPSSWLVNGRKERTGSVMYRNLLVVLSQALTRRIYGLLAEEFELHESAIMQGARSTPWEEP